MVTELELGTFPRSHGLQPRMSSPQPEEAEASVGSHCHFSCSPAFPARGYALLGAPRDVASLSPARCSEGLSLRVHLGLSSPRLLSGARTPLRPLRLHRGQDKDPVHGAVRLMLPCPVTRVPLLSHWSPLGNKAAGL